MRKKRGIEITVAARKRRKNRKKEKMEKKVLWIIVLFAVLFICLLAKSLTADDFLQKSNFFREIHRETEEKAIRKRKKRDQKKIRVLITDTSMSSIFHEEVKITGNHDFTVERNGNVESCAAGKVIELSAKESDKTTEKMVFQCPSGKLELRSVLRRQKIPAYRGSITIKRVAEGLLIINELTIKEYLYGVVPGEMSASYPMEALKVQAVCARSYAWNQKKNNHYKKYGAHVDDTTAFQVYNMAGEDKRTKKAVDDTAGELLYHGKEVITTYYYSTSWGSSATTVEAWGSAVNDCYPSKLQITKESRESTGIKSLDFRDEKIFRSFISKEICETYDQESPWYRWKVELPAEQLGLRLGIGTVKKIHILERGESGLLQKIKIEGTKGNQVIEGQQSIRERIMLSGADIETQDGNCQNLSLLPSAAFFVKDSVSNGKVIFQIIGGGFGHGVGMSQNGAAAMAEEGYSYQEILTHYYANCQIQ